MKKNKLFFPNEKCLKYAEEVIEELEIIIKYPTRMLERSPLKKYRSILEKEKCDDFLGICVAKPNDLRSVLNAYPFFLVKPPSILGEYQLEKNLRQKKKNLLDRCKLVLLPIKQEMEKEKADDRKELLQIAYILAERIAHELKSDLMI